MNKLHAQKVQDILKGQSVHQMLFVSKHGAEVTPAYAAAFGTAMMDAGDPLWKNDLAGVAPPLDLSGVDFTGGIFAHYGGEYLNRASFKDARLDQTRWFGVHAKHADFSGASLRDAFMAVFCCEGASFLGADLTKARLGLIAIEAPVDFSGAILSGAEFNLSSSPRLTLKDARLDGARLVGPRKAVDGFLAGLSERQRDQVKAEVSPDVSGEPPPPPPKSGCFIATAACGSEEEVDVLRLRAFRDRVLARSAPGRALVRLYERVSPPVADWIRTRQGARAVVRAALVRPASRFFGIR